MQFIRQKQQVTTCPQCDNVVRIDAEVCNICGKRLRSPSGRTQPVATATPAPLAPPPATRPIQTIPPPAEEVQEEEEEEDEYEEDEDEDEVEENEEELGGESLAPPAIPYAPAEVLGLLQYLQRQSEQIERYFPAHLPNKEQKLETWKKQIQRAQAAAELFERPQLQQVESPQFLKLRHHLAEAARALDFTHEYSVKVIGHAGAGKSTLLAAMIGRDIFPRLAGGAVTGVRTRIRLCDEQEPEEMRVHFLTRPAFEDILKQTQQSIHSAPNPRAREALAAELSALLKASEAFADKYLQDEQAYVEVIPPERWKEESSRYIEEPARDSQEPRLILLIDYVEYRVHTTPHSLLPPGSVLVDLPGGAAGQIRHDAILREELDQVDAIILVIGNNRFGDDDRTQRLFELVRRRVVQGRSPEVAAGMVFLAVTHWDEVNSAASKEKALGSLRPLLRELPANYNSYHHHGPAGDYFFYPLRGLDALFATLGIEGQQPGAERQQEEREYAGRVFSVYPELLQIDSTLPAISGPQDFEKITPQQHAAMLQFSGLPELINDLQAFLSGSRYDVQLRQAETQLAMALQQLEDLCWERLSNFGIYSHDLEELQQEMLTRKNKRGAARFEQLQKRTSAMHAAWNDALKEFDTAIGSEDNAFQRALMLAHSRAARRIKQHIMQGYFDHLIKVSNRMQGASPAMDIGNRWVDIDGWNLIKELRASFSAALERELYEPARTLAEAFLMPIAHREEIEGTLDINRVALGETGGELDELQKSYGRLKRSIRDKARDICLYVTMSELLNEEKYAPTKDDPAVSALYRLVSAQGKPEDIILQARQLMIPILDVICGQLAQSTERRIAHLFRYELDKLEERQVYDSDRLDGQPSKVPGIFSDLVNSLYSLLTERVLTSEALRQQLDMLQAEREADVDRWIELLRDTDALRSAHRQY
jgi:DNA replication protein DnaC